MSNFEADISFSSLDMIMESNNDENVYSNFNIEDSSLCWDPT